MADSFSAAVDFPSAQAFVNAGNIGVLGNCGSFALRTNIGKGT